MLVSIELDKTYSIDTIIWFDAQEVVFKSKKSSKNNLATPKARIQKATQELP